MARNLHRWILTCLACHRAFGGHDGEKAKAFALHEEDASLPRRQELLRKEGRGEMDQDHDPFWKATSNSFREHHRFTSSKAWQLGAELQPDAKELPEAVVASVNATMLPMVNATDPDAKAIVNTVVEKLANETGVEPLEKVEMVASTTSFDGIGLVVRAAEAAGLVHAQVKRMAETAAHLTVTEQLAAATALRAASEGPQVLSDEDSAEKVAAVVKAEVAAGVPKQEQASAVGAAVTAAAKKAKEVKVAEEQAEALNRIVRQVLKVGLDEDQAEAVLGVVSSMSSDEQAAIEQFLTSLLAPTPVTAATTSTTAPPATSSTTGMTPEPGTASFMFHVVPSSSSRSSYKAETGLSAKGFVFGVGLDVQGLVDFIQSKTGKELDPFELSLAYGSFLFNWPSGVAGCSEEESGFTDFESITFYNATFANPGNSCGDVMASTMDLDGVLRLPSEGDVDLFRLAGMFGSSEDSGGDTVTLTILDLLIFEIKASGEKVEYRVCGDSTGASYLGCPSKSPLKIKYPDNSLGQGVKICTGQSAFHEYKLENCFPV